jgi:hypothetical protein
MLHKMIEKRAKGKTVFPAVFPAVALTLSIFAVALTSCTSAVVGPAAAVQGLGQPRFQVVGLGVNPAVVKPGEDVQVVASVVNFGNVSGDYVADLKIDGLTSGISKVNVPAGSSQGITFRLSRDAARVYQVNMGELSGQFEVKAQQTDLSVSTSSAQGDASCCSTSVSGASGTTSSASGGGSCCSGSAASASTSQPGASVTIRRGGCCGQ